MSHVPRPVIGTSWKMNLTAREAADYLDRLVPRVAGIDDRDLFVLPAFPVLFVARDRLTGTNVAWGAQDVHPADSGPHTGDVSAPMLADLGCRFVEVGHAERRRDHGETPELIAAKVAAVLRWGMSAVVCMGEPRRSGPDQAVGELLPDLDRMVGGVADTDLGRLVIAYEPVWAIGESGMPARPDDVAQVHGAIHDWFEARSPEGAQVRVIYGGSVDAAIAGELLRRPGVDGLFIGRAALDPLAFAEIARTPIAVPSHHAR
jgi:triosephosphate isomerase